jgi:lipid-A-disaccharide synthase
LPFETEFYARHGVRAVFVGHPLADQIPLEVDCLAARRALGIDTAATVIALLPGSRMGEVQRLGEDFAAAAGWIADRRPDIQFIAPMATVGVRGAFERQIKQIASGPPIKLLDGQAQRALAAANAAIVASGTATLETLLSARPMVVAYRLGAFTAFLLRTFGLIKVPYFSQPNLLIGRRLVPEFFQHEVSGAALGAALLRELEDAPHVHELKREFLQVHEKLRRGGADRAAAAILDSMRGPNRREGE